MEEAVLHDLLDIVIYKLPADLAEVIALRLKTLLVIDRASADILHDKDAGSRILMVQLRASDVADPLVVPGEFLHVGGFLEEIHLLLRRRPEFVQDHLKIYHVLEAADRRKKPHCSL